MKQPVIYVLTHDSIYVGEDGPTHQPVETIAALRLIPGVTVLRPGDAEETAVAWEMAMKNKGPTVLALSRQNITVFPKDDPDWKNTILTGAYIVKKEDNPDTVIVAAGSEVNLGLSAAEIAEKNGKKVQVVSMLCRELFERQPAIIKSAIIPPSARVVAAEAGVKCGWEGLADAVFSIERFGESGPADKVAEHLGFTAEALAKQLAVNS
jgi:transketolase